jgi:hypothetical protein
MVAATFRLRKRNTHKFNSYTQAVMPEADPPLAEKPAATNFPQKI